MYKRLPLVLLLLLVAVLQLQLLSPSAHAQSAAHPQQVYCTNCTSSGGGSVSINLGGSPVSTSNVLPVGDVALDNLILTPGGGFNYLAVQGISDHQNTVLNANYSTIVGGIVSNNCDPFNASAGDSTGIALDLAQNVCVDLAGQTVNVQEPNYHAGTFTTAGCSFTTTAATCATLTTHVYVSIQNTSATDNAACVWGSATPALNSSTSFMILAGATRSWTATDIGIVPPSGALKCIGSATGGTIYIEYE